MCLSSLKPLLFFVFFRTLDAHIRNFSQTAVSQKKRMPITGITLFVPLALNPVTAGMTVDPYMQFLIPQSHEVRNRNSSDKLPSWCFIWCESCYTYVLCGQISVYVTSLLLYYVAKVVKDFKCFPDPSGMNCSWIPVNKSLNLTLSYR